MIEEKDSIFGKIELFSQKINKLNIYNLFYNIYNNIYFSTFPYLLYKENDSLTCIKKFSSGNCIAISNFIKIYLLNNYNIKSYIIPASVCSRNKVEGTPNMSHCAVLIPISLTEFYIIDSALYFLEPMYCSVSDNKKRTIDSSDIYSYQKIKIHYIIQNCNNTIIDKKYAQIVPENTLCVNSYENDNINDSWNYYLIEIKNPDNNIGYSFLSNKQDPFILVTKMNNNNVELKYKINYKDNELSIKEYPDNNIIYNGNTYDNSEILTNIKNELRKYFLEYII